MTITTAKIIAPVTPMAIPKTEVLTSGDFTVAVDTTSTDFTVLPLEN